MIFELFGGIKKCPFLGTFSGADDGI